MIAGTGLSFTSLVALYESRTPREYLDEMYISSEESMRIADGCAVLSTQELSPSMLVVNFPYTYVCQSLVLKASKPSWFGLL